MKCPRLGNEISFLPIQELSTGRNTWDWIPLNLFLLHANEKKEKMVKSFSTAKHYRYLTESLWREQASPVCPKGNVLEGSQHNSCQTASLKHFISSYALLNTAQEGPKWCYVFSIQCSLQELWLCLVSIYHLMVTGGGPPVTQPAPAGLTSGAIASLERQPKQKGVHQLP